MTISLAPDLSEWIFGQVRAVSDEAGRIRSGLAELQRSKATTASIGAPLSEAMERLSEAARQATEPNWDGYIAQPIDDPAYERAKFLLKALSFAFPTPEISVDPDGEVDFEWAFAPRRIFSVSIGPTGRLSYAGLFGTATVNGVEYLTDEVPKAIRTNLQRLFSLKTEDP